MWGILSSLSIFQVLALGLLVYLLWTLIIIIFDW